MKRFNFEALKTTSLEFYWEKLIDRDPEGNAMTKHKEQQDNGKQLIKYSKYSSFEIVLFRLERARIDSAERANVDCRSAEHTTMNQTNSSWRTNKSIETNERFSDGVLNMYSRYSIMFIVYANCFELVVWLYLPFLAPLKDRADFKLCIIAAEWARISIWYGLEGPTEKICKTVRSSIPNWGTGWFGAQKRRRESQDVYVP